MTIVDKIFIVVTLAFALLGGGSVLAQEERADPFRSILDRIIETEEPTSNPDGAQIQPSQTPVIVAPSPDSRLPPGVQPEHRLWLDAGDTSQAYVCEYPANGWTLCSCQGMLDCNRLMSSGACTGEGGTVWEDPDDPSVGGCDVPPGG